MDLRSSLDRATVQKQGPLFSINYSFERDGMESPQSPPGSRRNLQEELAQTQDVDGNTVHAVAVQIPPNFIDDFILVSEFSELEGPVPLFYIPDIGTPQGTFNVNEFVLRIMAVDYQNKSTDLSMYIHIYIIDQLFTNPPYL
jgi:hypothetical protein